MPRFVDLLSEGTAHICKKILRKWDVVQSEALQGVPLRLCCYNVLCQQTIKKTMELYEHLYYRGTPDALKWNNRWELLRREFQMINADVYCLQEVQHDHYFDCYEPFFNSAGYDGEYKKRTREMVDGCAIFYRRDFELCRYEPVEYFLNEKSVLDRDNIGQIMRLRDRRSQKEICIANTHLLFNKRRGDVKIAQLAIFLAKINKECGPWSGKECPYVLCGDFNILPYSPIHQFIVNGRLSFERLRSADMSGQGEHGGRLVSSTLLSAEADIYPNCSLKDQPNTKYPIPPKNWWTHPLCFSSVYVHTGPDSWPEISTYQSADASNPDFIFYSITSKSIQRDPKTARTRIANVYENNLRLIRRLSLPNAIQLQGTLGPWPNANTPSDHIPLVADFVLQ